MEEDFDIHFGRVDNPLIDWRNVDIANENADNDEDLPIEADVLSILGFDPDEE